MYGLTRSVSGTPTTRQGFVGGLGHESDDETGLIYMQHRYCDPSTGRFVSQDPGKDGINWFAYAKNNPVRYTDASGKIAYDALLELMDLYSLLLGRATSLGTQIDELLASARQYYKNAEEIELNDPEGYATPLTTLLNETSSEGEMLLGDLKVMKAESLMESRIACIAEAREILYECTIDILGAEE